MINRKKKRDRRVVFNIRFEPKFIALFYTDNFAVKWLLRLRRAPIPKTRSTPDVVVVTLLRMVRRSISSPPRPDACSI